MLAGAEVDAEKFAKASAAFEEVLEQAREVLHVSFFSFTRGGRKNGGGGLIFLSFIKQREKPDRKWAKKA